MRIFDHVVMELLNENYSDKEFKKISRQEFEIFLKEFTFDKIKGKKLGKAFADRFNVKDRVLQVYSEDKHALDHIKNCNYIED